MFYFCYCVGRVQSLKSNNPVLAGVMIGLLAAIKPNFLIWPVLMLFSGFWVVALVAFLFFAFFSILPLVRYGPTVYYQWFDALSANKAAPLATNMSLYGFASRLELPGLGLVLAALLLIVIALLVYLRRPTALDVSGLGIVVTLLASPLSMGGICSPVVTNIFQPALVTGSGDICHPVMCPLNFRFLIASNPTFPNCCRDDLFHCTCASTCRIGSVIIIDLEFFSTLMKSFII